MRMRNRRSFENFASMLREARASRQMTQAQLAKRLSFGQQAISNWERGKSRPESPEHVRAIANLFPEHRIGKWLEAAGYAPSKPNTEPASPIVAVRPLLDLLPLGALSWEQFQEFCATFLRARFPGATVNQFGVTGDPQEGIDIEVTLPDGRYFTIQCKRETEFGPGKVAAAIAAHRRKCDHAYILLSREATSAARNAVPKRTRGTKWTLWDSRDIAREIRAELSLTKALVLIDAFFPQHRKPFLGVDDPSAFESTAQYFAPLLRRDTAFSHAWTLVGRDAELESLQRSLDQPAGDLAILAGPGGVGKTRLVRAAADAFAAAHPAWHVLFLSASRQPTAQDFDQIASQQNLLIIEDAHDRSDLRAIFHATARLRIPPRILVTTRPYALQIVRGDAMSEGCAIADTSVTELKGLSVDRAEEVAREILNAKNGPVEAARHLARVTHDSPIALVVGSYLVATKRIHPNTLNNLQDFRAQLFARFRDAITGDIAPAGDEDTLRDTLNLVALARPVDPESNSFWALATHLIDAPPERIRRAFHLLYEAGVLVRRGRLHRIVPDLLGDYILEQTCIAPSPIGSLGYVERALERADAQTVSRIAVNISSLDWRLSAADRSASQVIEAVWNHIGELYINDHASHSALLEGVATAAYYQPRHALGFFDRAHAAGASDEMFARLLRNAAMNMDYVEDACARLWELGEHDERPLNQHATHPVRLMKELAAIEPRKPVEFCERIVEFAIRRLSSQDTAPSHLKLFELLDTSLAVEGHTTESRGRSIMLEKFAIRRNAVAGLRKRVITFLLNTIREADIPAASRAMTCLGHALRAPMNIGEGARAEWDVEFCETLQKLLSLVTSSPLDPVLLVEAVRAVGWHSGYAGEPTTSHARLVIDSIPQSLAYRVTLALIDGWGHVTRERGEDFQLSMNNWRAEQRNAADELISSLTDAAKVLEFLRERLNAIRLSRSQQASPAIFVSILTELRPDLAAAICESVLDDVGDALRDVFGQSLYQLAMRDPARAISLAERTLILSDVGLHRNVAWAYGARLRSPDGILPGERKLTEGLMQSADEFTVTSIIQGVGGQATVDRAWTIATLLSAPIERSARVADEVFGTFARPGDLSLDSLDDSDVGAFLDKLAACPSLDNHWVQDFLKHVALRLPGRLVSFLIGRVDKDSDDSERTFSPLPFSLTDRALLNFRADPNLSQHLRTDREWLLAAPRTGATIVWGPKLYAAVAGTFDQVVISDLDGWIHSGDMHKMAVVGRILSEAPNGFIFDHQTFVVDLLERATAVSKDCVDVLRSSLWRSAYSGMRHGTPGTPFPEDEARRTRSAESLAQVPRSSPAWALFNSLKEGADADIRQKFEQDEELFDA